MSFSAEQERDRLQLEMRRLAENCMLDDPGIDYREYKARREANLVTSPHLSLDAMDYRSYRVARDAGADETIRFSDVEEPSLVGYEGTYEVESE